MILVIILAAARRRVPMYETFVTGAKEGFEVAVMINPYLVAILFVVKVFLASGLFDDLKWGVARLLTIGGWEQYASLVDLLPLALTRPLTGGGAQWVFVILHDDQGPDSFIGLVASLMMGSTETTFYVMTVYFGR